MSEGEKKPRTLGLDDVQANALFAWQHGLFYEFHDDDLFNAYKSVEKKAKETGMTREELKQVPINKAWIRSRLLRLADKFDKKI